MPWRSNSMVAWLMGFCLQCLLLGAATLPASLKDHVHPPMGFEVDPQVYRSPLLREDGSVVDSPQAWKVHRQVLRQQWMEVMGPWPELLNEPVIMAGEIRRVDGYLEQSVRLQVMAQRWIDGWLLLPEGNGPFASVLVVFYDAETSIGRRSDRPGRDFGRQLVQAGLATLNIGTPGGDAWKPDLGSATCQPLSFDAYVAANLWLAMAAHPKLDEARIGITGHSYGGKWALFGGALWDRFAAVAVSDPGIVFDETRTNVNYWEPWYLGLDLNQPRPARGVPSPENPRTGAYQKMIQRQMDLHSLHALIAPRPFLVMGGSEDTQERWHALHHALSVNQMLGYQKRVFLTLRPDHAPSEVSNGQLRDFFRHFLQPQ